jgi:PAS domain-containing protein
VERVNRHRRLALVLARSFAAQLATAVFLVDAEGTVIYFNEAAERLLGQRFIEGAGMAAEWSTRYRPRDSEGHPVPLESLALGVTMLKREPAHEVLTILGADGVDRRIEVAAFPLFARHGGLRGRHRAVLGAAGRPVSAGQDLVHASRSARAPTPSTPGTPSAPLPAPNCSTS